MYATIAIPEGHSAKKIRINSDDNELVYIWETDLTTGVSTAIGATLTNTDYTLINALESTSNNYIKIGIWNIYNSQPVTVYGGTITLSN